MKRASNLYYKIFDIENLREADNIAQRGKSKQPGVLKHNNNKENNLLSLQNSLIDKTYSTSPYKVFTIFEPKERIISRLPYYPDRICHHAIMRIIEPIFVYMFTSDTYSCIKNRGVHKASKNLIKALKDIENTKYCLKLDIKKFYPNIDNDILKILLRKKIKDKELLWLLDEIITSSKGLPIGNYVSQLLSNFYMSYFDHYVKENLNVKNYFRYADDIIILSNNKTTLHDNLSNIKTYLMDELKLTVKENYQIFPVESRGIDFVGYVHYHSHVMLRKRIKKSLAKAIYKNNNKKSIDSYLGWAKHCNSKNLIKKLISEKI